MAARLGRLLEVATLERNPTAGVQLAKMIMFLNGWDMSSKDDDTVTTVVKGADLTHLLNTPEQENK